MNLSQKCDWPNSGKSVQRLDNSMNCFIRAVSTGWQKCQNGDAHSALFQAYAVQVMHQQTETVAYCIDADDNIISVNEAWNRFAIENDAAQLSTEVIGTSLWDHIVGVDVAHIYRDLLSRVRAKMVSASFPFVAILPSVIERCGWLSIRC